MQARMNRRDQSELIELITTWNKKKRGMIPRGHKLIIMLDVAPITPSPIVEVRVLDKTNGKKPTAKKSRKKWGDVESTIKMKLEHLGLSPRVYNKITNSERFKIKTIGELHGVIDDLYMIPNFGDQSIKECREKLASAGLVD
jgi:hypothetical protein